VKNHKIAKNSTTIEAREKISPDLEFLELKKAYVRTFLTKFKYNKTLLN
jgi:hypothetical protein